MYLRTPKRYTPKGSRRPLINLHWLWLYILFPVILIPLVLVWDYRDSIQPVIDGGIKNALQFNLLQAPTPTPTALPPDFDSQIVGAFSSGHVNKALELLNSKADVRPNDPAVYNLAAQILVLRSYSTNIDMLKQAVTAGQAAINANPEIPDGWATEALALDWSGKYQAALGYALRAADLDDKDPMTMVVMAEIYSDLGKSDQASKMIDDAIAAAQAAQPPDRAALVHAYYVKALLLSATDGKEAVRQFEEAWGLAKGSPPNPTIPVGYIAQQLASTYASLDQTDQAITLLGDAIKRDGDDPVLLLQMAKVYYKIGDKNKARLYVAQCIDLAPNEARCLRLMAQLFFGEQNYTQAIQTMQKVLDQGSKSAQDYYLAGLSYSYLNQCTTAISTLQLGIAYIAPDDAQTRANYEDALRGCGATSGLPVTPTDTPAATATFTPTPGKKR